LRHSRPCQAEASSARIQGLDEMTDRRCNRGERTNGEQEAISVSVPPSRRTVDEAFLDRTIELFQARTGRTALRAVTPALTDFGIENLHEIIRDQIDRS
jgi:hypothetical protein